MMTEVIINQFCIGGQKQCSGNVSSSESCSVTLYPLQSRIKCGDAKNVWILFWAQLMPSNECKTMKKNLHNFESGLECVHICVHCAAVNKKGKIALGSNTCSNLFSTKSVPFCLVLLLIVKMKKAIICCGQAKEHVALAASNAGS